MDQYLPSSGAVTGEALAPIASRILVIEDSRVLQTPLLRLLREVRPDSEVDWVTTADEVVQMFRHREAPLNLRNYELVIADLTLPGTLTGLDFWEICRRAYPRIPFLIISGIGTEQFLALTSKLRSPPSFLPKPFTLGDFRRAIESQLTLGDRLKAA